MAVTDLASAKEAMSLIIAQGEGAWPPADGKTACFGELLQMGHYYRFSEIAHGRRYQPADDPAGAPTGQPIGVDYAAAYPIKVNEQASDYAAGSKLASLNKTFNIRYTTMLIELSEAINGVPKTLYTAIWDSMHELTPIAHEMMKIAIDGDPDGHTGCPTFEWGDGYTLDRVLERRE
jgi:hypothetical protein